ncbi:cora-domain-containing protein [Aaosphaeria arxii CBS 175.79]|uniref:Magnesium transporter n=1 Tax=Aaosphaeria arxii CBS 175.79 TaxID=1450172 RepID=A0A6A5XWN6_9PLEO|nr:cora-domain-containing protein [Aaosphaeria arxii CBS 175.79]KAF2017366.1 cora-domain-containing protein [Aaosphaeria arxii CBS 175.79]
MKSILPRNLAAPSSAVLNFLRSQVRNAFQPNVAPRCTAFGVQSARGIATCAKEGILNNSSAGRNGAFGRLYKDTGLKAIASPVEGVEPQSRCTSLATIQPRIAESRATNHLIVPRDTCHRAFSTTATDHASWLPFRQRRRQRAPSIPTPSPPLSSFLDDATPNSLNGIGGLGRVSRSANELKMRCTELDEHGNVTMVSGEFKKSELIAKYGLLPRDLRKIDSSLLPHILVRPSAILINLLHLRVLIKHNRVLVFDAYGTTDSKSQSVFMYDLDSKLRQKESVTSGTLAYEFRALEAVLISVTLGLEKELEGVSEPVVKVLMELEEDIDRDKLRYLLIYSKKLGSFEQKARLVRDALTELLEADDDLSAMYLSDKAAGTLRDEHDHTEVEMLLESYHKVADEIVQAAENLVSSIRNTEEIVKAILDANRNSLMLLDLKFSILTLAITAGTFVAALYGMNLKNFIEESDIGFFGISAWCTVFGTIVAIYGLGKLRKVQRVSMWGHGGGAKSTSGWGLGLWGGRSSRITDEASLGACTPRLRAGETVGDLILRERAVAKRLANAERKADDAFNH